MERISGGRTGPNNSPDRYYAAIGSETGRLEGLVNRLLDAQKLQAGQKHYAFRRNSLEVVARGVVERMGPQAEAKGITLRLHVQAPVPDLPFDRESVADAVGNLVDNAIKYSPAHTEIDVALHATDREALLEVCDQGIGVNASEADRIFDPFYRSPRGDQENVHGTGLGLSLVKAAAKAHGGSVEVSSHGARGSCFRLRLPIPPVAAGDSGRPEPAE